VSSTGTASDWNAGPGEAREDLRFRFAMAKLPLNPKNPERTDVPDGISRVVIGNAS
jgi:hypothetical protein